MGRISIHFLFCSIFLLGSPAVFAQDLVDLSVEELMDVEVFSVSRRQQTVFESAAAVDVITSEEIRRSGATRLPEVLRLVLGVHAKHIDANKWAVTVRGFNNRFANKLLVLIDGRSVYSPLFAGVWWEVQDLPLDIVDRVEVIRGPGGTLWGANAVNGVINVITKRADETQDTFVKGGYGPEERGFGSVTHGGRLADNTFYRVYGKGLRRDALVDSVKRAEADDWHMLRGGFRIDEVDGATTWRISGEAYDGRLSQTMEDGAAFTIPYMREYDYETEVAGRHILVNLTHHFETGAEFQFTGYYDWTTRADTVFAGTWHTVGFDVQHRFALGKRQSVVWGGEFRITRDQLGQSHRFTFNPDRRTTRVFSGFVQDEIHFFGDRLRWIFGSKFEHNDFTGVEVLPNVRVAWTDPDHTLWGAVSRSVRLPTRGEADTHHLDFVAPLSETPNAPIVVFQLVGNPEMKSEKLVAYELGYRRRFSNGFTFDLVTFYNRYTDHFSGEPHSIEFDNGVSPVRIYTSYTAKNKMSGNTFGGEVVGEWQVLEGWRLRGGYAYLNMNMKLNPDSEDPGTLEFVADNPTHRFMLWSLWNVTPQIELDAVGYYTADLPEHRDGAFFSLDVHANWHVTPAFSISLVGKHLVGYHRIGLDPEVVDTQATYNQRNVFGALSWKF